MGNPGVNGLGDSVSGEAHAHGVGKIGYQSQIVNKHCQDVLCGIPKPHKMRVDLFGADRNCAMPIDPLYAERYKLRLVTVSELVSFEGITERINYLRGIISGQTLDSGLQTGNWWPTKC